jgi:hypothetical protein
MRRAFALAFAAAAVAGVLPLAGCNGRTTQQRGGGPKQCDADPVTGTWVDQDAGSYITVAIACGAVSVLFIVDNDGEVYPVSDAAYDGITLEWTHVVPSTGYTLYNEARLQDPSTLVGTHTGSHEGSDVYKRWAAP